MCLCVYILCVCMCVCVCIQGKVVGVFKKDEFSGDFADGWKTTLNDSHMTQVSASHDPG